MQGDDRQVEQSAAAPVRDRVWPMQYGVTAHWSRGRQRSTTTTLS
jgi:hypothetical protein